MRRQLTQRLQEWDVGIEESVAYYQNNPDISIINQLDDISEVLPELHTYPSRRAYKKTSVLQEMQMKSISPRAKYRHQYAHEEAQKQIQKLIGERTKAKIELREKGRAGWIGSASPRHYDKQSDNQIGAGLKRTANLERPYLEAHKDKDNFAIKIKAEHNRSLVIKNKELIQGLINSCTHCGEQVSQVFREALVCCNSKCRGERSYETVTTFPLLGLLYDIEIPASSLDDLNDLLKKITEELQKIQSWRKELLNLQFQVQAIAQKRKEQDRETRAEVREFLASLNNAKKIKNQPGQLDDFKASLANIRLSKTYEEFLRWSRLNTRNFQLCGPICQALEKCKPLCLKEVQPKLFKQMADVSNNFRSTSVKVNISSTILHTFSGKIGKLTVCVDGSIQLKQNCFLLIEEIDELVIEFHSKKTSRELREILHILPVSNKLTVEFDFKAHSHVSSEAFPLLSKLSQKGRQQIHLTFNNARPQFIEDIMTMSRSIGEKTKVYIDIKMNPYVGLQEIPENLRQSDWGTLVLRTLLRSIGPKVTHLHLNLPIYVKREEVCEFILNNDYPNLISWYLNTLPSSEQEPQSLEELLETILSRRVMMLGLILNQKKNKNKILEEYPEVKAAVFHMLA